MTTYAEIYLNLPSDLCACSESTSTTSVAEAEKERVEEVGDSGIVPLIIAFAVATTTSEGGNQTTDRGWDIGC